MPGSDAITSSPGTIRLSAATISARRASTASSNSGINGVITNLSRGHYSEELAAVDMLHRARLNGGRVRVLAARNSAMTRTMITAALIAASASAALAQDAAKGEQVFARCAPCHAVGPNAENKLGPELNGLDGRHSGTAANFSYSDANKGSGIVWNETPFKKYIQDPKAMIPGTKMTYVGDKNPEVVDDLWAYVKQFDADGNVKK